MTLSTHDLSQNRYRSQCASMYKIVSLHGCHKRWHYDPTISRQMLIVRKECGWGLRTTEGNKPTRTKVVKVRPKRVQNYWIHVAGAAKPRHTQPKRIFQTTQMQTSCWERWMGFGNTKIPILLDPVIFLQHVGFNTTNKICKSHCSATCTCVSRFSCPTSHAILPGPTSISKTLLVCWYVSKNTP